LIKLFFYYINNFGYKSIFSFIDRCIRKVFPNWAYRYLCFTTLHVKFFKNKQLQFSFKSGPKNFDCLTKKDKKDLISNANDIIRHHFNMLSPQKVFLDKKIIWNFDANSNYQWETLFYSSYKQKDLLPGKGSDIKVPWELNRLHHLVVLAQAYRLSKEKKYLIECLRQFEDWKNDNPLCYGINWSSTMEVSIRAVNLIVLLNLIYDSVDCNKKYIHKIENSIIDHGIFIMNNLEIGFSSSKLIAGNHYLANISALYIIGLFFRGSKISDFWYLGAKVALEDSIDWMVHNDGFYFESSTNYHRYALELFLYPYIFGKLNDQKFSFNYRNKLQMMADTIFYLNTPGNTIPQIGDNDSGRYLIFNNYFNWNSNDHRYLLSICSVIFERGDYKYLSKSYPIELFWIFGENIQEYFNNIVSKRVIIESKSFQESGLYVIRNDKRKDYALIKGHANNKMMHGHSHNDILSIELWISGETVFIDPGTYCYTSNLSLRNTFRSTKNHSTIIINSNELNKLGPGAFEMNWDTKFICQEWTMSDGKVKFVGLHDAYSKNFGFDVKRTIIYKNSCWFIKDELIGDVEKLNKIENRWILSPLIKNIILKGNKIILNDSILLSFSHSKEVLIYDTQYSSKYGTKTNTKALKNTFKINQNNFSELKIFPKHS